MILIRLLIILFSFLASIFLNAQQSLSEEIMLKNGPIELSGTLTIPEGVVKPPLAIFIHGSGNIDRNGNQTGVSIKADYIKMLNDSLVMRGIAFFRYDKRTANPNNRAHFTKNAVFESLVDDAKIIIEHFKKDFRFKNITVIGHSQGSLVGMLACSPAVEKYVSLAGLSETMQEAVVRQMGNQNPAIVPMVEAHFNELMATDTIKQVNPVLLSLFHPLNHQFIKTYNAYRPEKVIKNVEAKTLIINGDADSQVRVLDAELLFKAKPGAQLAIIPKMNHLLKEVHSAEENLASYYKPDYPISAQLVEILATFIKN